MVEPSNPSTIKEGDTSPADTNPEPGKTIIHVDKPDRPTVNVGEADESTLQTCSPTKSAINADKPDRPVVNVCEPGEYD